MQDFSTFLVDNWQMITSVILCLGSLIFNVIKKRPTIHDFEDLLDYISFYIPAWIISAEKSGKDGSDKKFDVMSKCLALLERKVVLTDAQRDQARKRFSEYIEAVLTCPQKKG